MWYTFFGKENTPCSPPRLAPQVLARTEAGSIDEKNLSWLFRARCFLRLSSCFFLRAALLVFAWQLLTMEFSRAFVAALLIAPSAFDIDYMLVGSAASMLSFEVESIYYSAKFSSMLTEDSLVSLSTLSWYFKHLAQRLRACYTSSFLRSSSLGS